MEADTGEGGHENVVSLAILNKAPSGLDVLLHDTPGHDQNTFTKKEEACAQTACMIEKEAWVSVCDGDGDDELEPGELVEDHLEEKKNPVLSGTRATELGDQAFRQQRGLSCDRGGVIQEGKAVAPVQSSAKSLLREEQLGGDIGPMEVTNEAPAAEGNRELNGRIVEGPHEQEVKDSHLLLELMTNYKMSRQLAQLLEHWNKEQVDEMRKATSTKVWDPTAFVHKWNCRLERHGPGHYKAEDVYRSWQRSLKRQRPKQARAVHETGAQQEGKVRDLLTYRERLRDKLPHLNRKLLPFIDERLAVDLVSEVNPKVIDRVVETYNDIEVEYLEDQVRCPPAYLQHVFRSACLDVDLGSTVELQQLLEEVRAAYPALSRRLIRHMDCDLALRLVVIRGRTSRDTITDAFNEASDAVAKMDNSTQYLHGILDGLLMSMDRHPSTESQRLLKDVRAAYPHLTLPVLQCVTSRLARRLLGFKSQITRKKIAEALNRRGPDLIEMEEPSGHLNEVVNYVLMESELQILLEEVKAAYSTLSPRVLQFMDIRLAKQLLPLRDKHLPGPGSSRNQIIAALNMKARDLPYMEDPTDHLHRALANLLELKEGAPSYLEDIPRLRRAGSADDPVGRSRHGRRPTNRQDPGRDDWGDRALSRGRTPSGGTRRPRSPSSEATRGRRRKRASGSPHLLEHPTSSITPAPTTSNLPSRMLPQPSLGEAPVCVQPSLGEAPVCVPQEPVALEVFGPPMVPLTPYTFCIPQVPQPAPIDYTGGSVWPGRHPVLPVQQARSLLAVVTQMLQVYQKLE